MKAVVVGAGGIGQWTAHQIGLAGGDVVLASRSGSGVGPGVSATPNPRVTTAKVDATDAKALAELATGADVLVNAVNPPYTDWEEKWPPMAAGFLEAAELSGAALLTIGNLYPYGHPTTPMIEATTPEAPNGHKVASGRRCGTTPKNCTAPAGSGPPRSGPPTTSARARARG